MRSPGSRLGLREGLGGQHFEDDGDARLPGDLRHTASRLGGHELEVRRLAPHDGPEADDGVVGARGGHPSGDQWDLERAGHPGDVDRVMGHAMRPETSERPLQELGRHVLMEARDHDRDAAPLADLVPTPDAHDRTSTSSIPGSSASGRSSR